jgi:hypothetical protein
MEQKEIVDKLRVCTFYNFEFYIEAADLIDKQAMRINALNQENAQLRKERGMGR